MRKIYLVLSLALLGIAANAQRTHIYAVRTGAWTAANTWNLNRQPGNNDSIVIPKDFVVTLSGDKALTNVIIDIFGILRLDDANGNGQYNDLQITTTTNNPNSPVVRLFDGAARIERGIDNNGSARIQVRINNAGDFYTKYENSGTALTGPSVAFNNTDLNFDFASNGSLPVVLVEFLVSNTEKLVSLKWKTQQENNSDRYIIERSTDSKKWQSIGEVPAAATSQGPHNYSFTDDNPVSGINYYRLRMMDRDGKSGLTAIKAARISSVKTKLSIYPNPAISQATIYIDHLSPSGYNISVYNRTGQLVISKKMSSSSNIVNLDVSRLTPGDYSVEVSGDGGMRQAVRLAVIR